MKERPTERLNSNDPRLQEILKQQQKRKLGTATLSKGKEVLLLIDSGLRRIELRNDIVYLLGRFNKTQPDTHYIDLSPFDAYERGVSRVHAKLHMDNNILYITDLGSTNGTYMDGVQLEANQKHVIRQGSEIILSRLHIQVMHKTFEIATVE